MSAGCGSGGPRDTPGTQASPGTEDTPGTEATRPRRRPLGAGRLLQERLAGNLPSGEITRSSAGFGPNATGPNTTGPSAGTVDQDRLRRLPLLLRRAHESLDRFLLEAAHGAGQPALTMTAIHALRRTSGAGAPVAALAEHLRISRQGGRKVVLDLDRRGLVVVYPHPFDGRAGLVQSTRQGAAVLAAVDRAVEDAVGLWAEHAADHRLADLLRDLEILADDGMTDPDW